MKNYPQKVSIKRVYGDGQHEINQIFWRREKALDDAARIINLDQVIFLTSLGKTTLYQLQKAGKFPLGVRLGGTRSTGWLLAEVEAWVKAQFNKKSGG